MHRVCTLMDKALGYIYTDAERKIQEGLAGQQVHRAAPWPTLSWLLTVGD